MAHYVDGYVIPIPKKNIKAYTKMAKLGCRMWMKHGALSYYETVADDLMVHGMGFKKMCKLKAGETVVFAFVVYKNKAHRDKVNKKVFAEMNETKMPKIMPFDMKRFSVGGFRTLVKG